MRNAALLALWMVAQSAPGQTTLAPPQVGLLQDGAGALRPVYGIAGNFLIGDIAATNVLSAAFSGSSGMMKTSSAVSVIDRNGQALASTNAPAGPALFAFSRAGEPALAYVPAAGLLLAWKDGAFEPVPFAAASLGEVVVRSLGALEAGRAALIVQRDNGLWEVRVSAATGEIVSQAALAGVTPPALLLAGGELVYSDAQGIVIRKADGFERHVGAPLPQNFALEQLGDGWIQIRDLSDGPQFAVRIAAGREQSYQLPEVEQ